MKKAKTETANAKKPAAKAKSKSIPKKTAKPVVAKVKPAAVAAKVQASKPVQKPVAAKPAVEVKKVSPARSAAPPAARPAVAPPPAPMSARTMAANAQVVSTPAAKKLIFKVNELVVYPAHGVGRISQIEEQEIAGAKLELYIVDFEKEKLRLKVPTGRAEQKGMRRLSDKIQIESALKVL